MISSHTVNSWKAIGRLAAALACGLVGGALIAPHVFNAALYLGRNFSALQVLRNVEFEKVASRCALICLLCALVPMFRASGHRSWEDFGFRRGVGWKRHLLVGWGIGVISMLVLLTGGLLAGAYTLGEGASSLGAIVGHIVLALIGSMLVGYIEEPLFRGGIYGMLRDGLRLLPAAMLASVIFSAVHFAAPDPEIGVVVGRWDSGFRMIPHMFSAVDMRWEIGLMSLTLFFMGMTLCLLYSRFGNLYAAIGLHAGWVWIMRLGEVFLERRADRLAALFGAEMAVAKSCIALITVFGVFLVSAVLYVARPGERT